MNEQNSEAVIRRQSLADSRRAQILEAAEACALRAGFHGASMAEIAKQAGLSVGQIYRYFENKAAIIAGIARRDRDEFSGLFDALEHSDDLLGGLSNLIIDAVRAFAGSKHAVLMVETVAETARNEEVARMVRLTDAEERQRLLDTVARLRRPDWSDDDVLLRTEMMAIIIEGIAVRAILHPELDKEKLAQLAGCLVRHALDSESVAALRTRQEAAVSG